MEAARRARGKIRRYCTANRLNRLGTLTYAGAGNHDPLLLREHLGVFFRRLRGEMGGEAFPYLWVPEWHKSGHGLHVHFAVGRFIPRRKIEVSWGHGFVHIKLLGDLPVGSGRLAEARRAALYLAKYAGKDFDRAIRARRRADGDIEWTRPDGTPIMVRWPHHLLRPIEDEDPTSGPDP